MKKTYAFLLLLACTFALQAQNPAKNKIVFIADFDYLEACEKGTGDCKAVILERKTTRDSLLVIFPNGGTVSDVYLYPAATNVKATPLTTNYPAPALRHDCRTMAQGKPVIDLTDLPDGTYYASMISCNLGGTFQIIIKTACEPKC